MFKNMKKWASLALASELVCGMMVPQIAFAEETDDSEEEYIETSVTISNLPETVKAGESGSFTVTVTGDDLEGCYLEIYEGSDMCELSVDTVENLVSGEAIKVDFKVKEWAADIIYLSADLYDADGYWVESAEEEMECIGMLTASMVFEPTTTVVAGTTYPYSVTLTNQSDTAAKNINMKVYASWHLQRWAATVTGETQEGVSFADGNFVIGEIPANSSITLKGTITFPTSAVGDSSHVIAAAYIGENLMASCGSEDDATGNDDYYFKIVSASENIKSGSVKTADTTQIMSLVVMMFMAMVVIVAVKKAR